MKTENKNSMKIFSKDSKISVNVKNEKNKLIILASHNREDIDVLCDEVYEMEDGVLRKNSNVKSVTDKSYCLPEV